MTTKTVHKLYWDFEKEERWLNEMSAKGLNLVRYRWGTYTFETGAPGQWIYRLELLPTDSRKPDSRQYLDFMSETAVETVATYMRWVYFRKPAADGPFEVFSDLDSRMAHYQRILTMFASVTAALVPITVVNIVNVTRSGIGLAFVLPLFVIYLALVVTLATQTIRLSRRVRELREQKQVYE